MHHDCHQHHTTTTSTSTTTTTTTTTTTSTTTTTRVFSTVFLVGACAHVIVTSFLHLSNNETALRINLKG
jgi:hypothetical protein